MKRLIRICVMVLVIVLAMVGLSQAYTYATDVRWDAGVSATPGYNDVRDYQTNALGEPDSKFLSLGFGGIAVFAFDTEFSDAAVIFETTYSNRSGYEETADVYVATGAYTSYFESLASENGAAEIIIDFSLFTYVGSISNLFEESVLNISGVFQYLLIVDTTDNQTSGRDGFDINAVGVSPVPEPATFVLLGCGLAGLVAVQRRKK